MSITYSDGTVGYRYTVELVGKLWWPSNSLAATTRTFCASDDADALERVDASESGDFSELVDFALYREDMSLAKGWDSEDNEVVYYDCVYPSED